MTNILVPIDLAEATCETLSYALRLAEKIQAQLYFFHVTHPLVPTTTPAGVYGELVKKNLHERNSDLQALVNESFNHCALPYDEKRIKFVVKDGLFTPESVLEAIEKYHIDLVLMDTHGATGIRKVLWGTNTNAVLEQAPCPVLAIPSGYGWKGVAKIAYASDLLALTQELNKIIDFARIFEAEVQIFHVYPVYPEKVRIANVKNEELLAELKEFYKYDKISLYFIHSGSDNDLEKGIELFIEAYKPDMLVMFTHERSLFDKIFNSSKTEEVVAEARVPVLALKD